MERVAVFGGTGFIGSHLVRQLVSAGVTATILTRTGRPLNSLSSVLESVNVVYGDFQDESVYSDVLRDVDTVFHLVTTTFPNSALRSSIYDVSTNLLPTIRLLEECERRSVKKFVYLSSGGTVYGNQGCLPITEETPLNPISIYGNSKRLIENYIQFFSKSSQIDITVLRVSNPYGPGQSLYGNQGLVAVLCQRILSGRPIQIYGDGSAARDYIYIDDLINAILLASRLEGGSTLNISTGVGTTVSDIVNLLVDISGERLFKKFVSAEHGMVSSNVLDNSKAQRELNWHPEVGLADGLARTWEWAKSRYADV